MSYWNGSAWVERDAQPSRRESRATRWGATAVMVIAAGLLIVPFGSALAGKPASGHITVQTPVRHGETTTATVNPGGANRYVLLKCYAPDLGGALVYGGYFSVNAANQSTLGPFSSYQWTSGGGTCTATEGYFLRDGLGKWVVDASTTFSVAP
jgi:hypothetical protein